MKFDGFCPFQELLSAWNPGFFALRNFSDLNIRNIAVVVEAIGNYLNNVFSAAEITKLKYLQIKSMTSNIIGGLDSFVEKKQQQ
ncbi:hypothetical protein [Paenibacillus camerounensis]|uniref:hypothetical protein n=1 Tax=Paenibacillus camerounensis TaxID=1243663 RepID=UPI0005A83094|nr:hypothetical protein [Paenibacillus camerounensis]